MEANKEDIIEEKIMVEQGEIIISKYYKKNLSGKGEKHHYKFIDSETNEKFTAKIVPKIELEKMKFLSNEIKIHRFCKHRNIASFQRYFEDSKNVYILQEFCKNGTLEDVINKRKILTELEVKYYMKQLINAIIYLHKSKIIHGNLKLSNLLISEKMELKLTGFKFSIKITNQEMKLNKLCGTPHYMAPEILDIKIKHSYEIDIWALGVMIYKLIIGEFPFKAKDRDSAYEKIKKLEYSFPETIIISKEAKDLITKILVIEPSKRLSLEQILNHDFFKQSSIPNFLPSSTLEHPPSLGDISQIISEEDEFGTEINVKTTKEPAIYVVKFVDYSNKYGTAYLLSNGFCGVYFNDHTKIILNPISNVFYYKKNVPKDITSSMECFNMNNYPEHLKKKVTLLKEFQKYLIKENENVIRTNKINENDNKNEPFTFVITWRRIERGNLFRLTNKITQFIFNDKTEIILSNNNQKLCIFTDKNKEKTILPIATAIKSSNKEMVEKLEYLKNILTEMLNKRKEKDMKNLQDDNASNNKSKKLTTFNSIEKIKEEDKINIEFTSIDQTIIDLSILCKKNDTFNTVKNLILNNYPELKDRNIYFLVNGGIVEEIKTLEQNKIKTNSKILIADENSFYL